METRKAKLIVTGNRRRDGKYKTKYIYPGAPNMFGGYEHSRTFNKLKTADQIREDIDRGIYEFTVPVEILKGV